MIREVFPDERAAEAWALDLAKGIEATTSPEEAIDLLAKELGAKTHPYALGVFLVDPREGLVLKHAIAHGALAARPVRVPPMQGIVGFVTENRVPLHVPDVARDPRYIRGHLVDARAALAVPILAGRRSFGAIDVEEDHPDAFDGFDLQILGSLARALGSVLSRTMP